MSWRLLFGFVVLIIGTGALLEQLQVLPSGTMHNLAQLWWPGLIVVVGLNQLIRRSEHPWISIIVVGLGLSLFSVTFRGPLSPLLFAYALILVLIGLQMLLPRRIQRADILPKKGKKRVPVKHQLKEWIVFSGMFYQNNSQQFQGGQIYTIGGDYILDLREAILNMKGAELLLFSIFGNITILVPETMSISFSGSSALGSLDNLTRQIVDHEPGRPKLILRGDAICSNIVVKN